MDLKTFYQVSYGLYIISAQNRGRLNGQIANTVFQITAEPPTLAVSINRQNLTYEFIAAANAFTISILGQETPMPFIGRFGFKSGRDLDKFADVKYRLGATGQPIVLEHAVGYFELELINRLDVGTHTIFIGRVVEAERLSDERPLTYEYYREVKKGHASRQAPTYLDPKILQQPVRKEKTNMAEYVCKVCGYIYDPNRGDPDNGVKPGTPFEALPHGWVCPICGADKDQFEKKG